MFPHRLLGASFQTAVLAGVFFCGSVAAQIPAGEPAFRLIAHRGGVVDGHLAEESLESVEAAIARGYWMVEIDVRSTVDGVPIAQHDPDFTRFYGDSRQVADLTFAETQKLRTNTAGRPPVPLEDLVKASRGRIRLMLDFKEPHQAALCERVEEILRKWEVLPDCYIIGTGLARRHFAGKAMVGAYYKTLVDPATGVVREPALSRYFLFERGMNLTPVMIAWANRNNVLIVPYVNEYHYEKDPDMMGRAQREIERLKAAGIRVFQIDSDFDRWFAPVTLPK